MDLADRNQLNPALRVNLNIDSELAERLYRYAALGEADISQRIEELKRESAMEQTFQAKLSILGLAGLVLAAFHNKKWLILPGIVLLLFFQRMMQGQGWLAPVYHRMGLRTQKEIDQEMIALKALQGDFEPVSPQLETDPRQRVQRALLAVEARHPSQPAQAFNLTLAQETPENVLDPGSIFFVGTATIIIRYNGFTLLTDPNFLHAGEHAYLGYGISVPRQTNPAIEIEDLPPLDLCLLSHMHGDHWDQVAEQKLRKDLPIVTTHQASDILKQQGFTDPHPLNPWDQLTLWKGDAWLRITAMPGKHGPGVLSAMLPPVMGSMLEWGNGSSDVQFRLYISGDTLVIDGLKEIPVRYPDIDLALLHLGGTRLMGVLLTMDARQGIQALHLVQPMTAIPIHYNDYPVFKSPLEDFMRAVEAAGLEPKIHYLQHGETYLFEGRKNLEGMTEQSG